MEETILSERLSYKNISDKSANLKRPNKKLILDIICHFFILLFLYASLRKLVDYRMFVREVYSLSVVEATKWGIGAFSFGELIAAIALTIPKIRFLGICGAFILMCTLNVAGLLYLQKIPIAPPMSGEIFPVIGLFGHILINILILFVALIALLLSLDIKKDNRYQI